MLSSLLLKKNDGAPLQSRKAMLETLFRHLDMVRLSAAAALLVLVSCTGLIDGGSGGPDDGLTPQQRVAHTAWETQALPVLKPTCAVCHAGQRTTAPAFLAGKTDDLIYATLVASPEVNFDAPESSRILTKSQHDGPALTAEQSAAVLAWLEAEKDAESSGQTAMNQLLTIPAFALTICSPGTAPAACPANTQSFSALGGDYATKFGTVQISFSAQAIATGLYLSRLNINGGTSGVHVEHPLFVSRPANADPVPDQIDRFFDLKLDVPANAPMATPIDGGAAFFDGFNPTDKLEIHFKVVGPFQAQTAPMTGCRALDKFTAADAAFQTMEICTSCHAGSNTSATNAMNLGGLTSKPADIATACNNVLANVLLTNFPQSPIFLAPASANHPYKFMNQANFVNALNAWMVAEKTAP